MRRVLVVGSANLDLSVRVPHLPREGETVLGDDLVTTEGGKGANQAVAAERAGAETRFIACVGQDAFGERIIRQLGASGVPSEGVLREPSRLTGVALIVVDQAGRNQIAVSPGASRSLTPRHLEAQAASFDWADVVLMQLEIPQETVARGLRMAKERGKLTILNPAPARLLPDGLLGLADILTPNEKEAAALSGLPVFDPESAVAGGEQLLLTGCGVVVITLGWQGAVMVRAGEQKHFPAPIVQVVDSTGAGDAFCGAMAAALADGRGLEEAVRWGNAAGALACTVVGAQEAMPTREAIEQLLRRSGPVTEDPPFDGRHGGHVLGRHGDDADFFP